MSPPLQRGPRAPHAPRRRPRSRGFKHAAKRADATGVASGEEGQLTDRGRVHPRARPSAGLRARTLGVGAAAGSHRAVKRLEARKGADAGRVAPGTRCGHPLTCSFPYVFTFSYVPHLVIIVTSAEDAYHRGQPPPRSTIPGIQPRGPPIRPASPPSQEPPSAPPLHPLRTYPWPELLGGPTGVPVRIRSHRGVGRRQPLRAVHHGDDGDAEPDALRYQGQVGEVHDHGQSAAQRAEARTWGPAPKGAVSCHQAASFHPSCGRVAKGTGARSPAACLAEATATQPPLSRSLVGFGDPVCHRRNTL